MHAGTAADTLVVRGGRDVQLPDEADREAAYL